VARVEQQQRSTAASVRELSGAVETVQEQVRETNLRIDELGPATLDLITQQRNDDEQVIRRFVEAPTWKSTQALFNTARNLNAVGDSIACELGSSGRWLFFGTGTRPARAQGYLPALEVMLDFSEPEMRPAASVYWTPNEDAQVFMQKLANRLKQIQKYPGDRQFDASRDPSRACGHDQACCPASTRGPRHCSPVCAHQSGLGPDRTRDGVIGPTRHNSARADNWGPEHPPARLGRRGYNRQANRKLPQSTRACQELLLVDANYGLRAWFHAWTWTSPTRLAVGILAHARKSAFPRR